MELALGTFVANDLGSPFSARAEPVDGTLVLLMDRSHTVWGWPVVDAGTRPPVLRIAPGFGIPGPGQNPALTGMVGNFHGQSRTSEPNDDQGGQHEGCTSTENVHGSLRGMTSFAMTLARVLTMSSQEVHEVPKSPLATSSIMSRVAGDPARMDKLLSGLRAAVRNPARLRLLADAPSIHARREGEIASVVDRLRRLLGTGGTSGIRMKSIGGTKLVPWLGQTFHHRIQLGAKLAHPVVIEKRGQHTLDIVGTNLELDRVVTAANVCFDSFNTGLDRSIAREPRLGLTQR
jgi:hypothetical protein